MFKIDKKLFENRLLLTKEWTRILSNDFDFESGFYGTVFRRTNPLIKNTLLYSIDGDYAKWNVDDQDVSNYKTALELAILARQAEDVAVSSIKGRILCFSIGFSTNDGVAVFESDCFMDESDVPPIDTWFYISENQTSLSNEKAKLYCWIPEGFEEKVQKAINAEMMGSYCWIDNLSY